MWYRHGDHVGVGDSDFRLERRHLEVLLVLVRAAREHEGQRIAALQLAERAEVPVWSGSA